MKSLVVGTAGHIDHGKSALVQALTGSDPDRLQEEKSRGITIDLGFAHYEDGQVQVAFVDVPGHERFVRNMLAGASGIDCVVLVIAADESVMPQTREHFDICRLLGVTTGVVVLTKCDLVDDETVEIVRLEAAELVESSFLEHAPVVSVSARTGVGLDELRAALARVVGAIERRSSDGATRIPVDRAFTVKGFGTVVTGTQVSGEVTTGKELDVLPTGRRAKVRGLQVHGASCDTARAGQRVAVNLAGLEVGDLTRGDVLVEPGGFIVTRRLDATVTALASARPLKHAARVRFHTGTSEVMARLSLGGELGGSQVGLAALEPGGTAYARLRLEQPVVVTRGDRFVLRAYSPPITIAGGRVLDPSPGKGRFRSAAGLARLRRLDRWQTPDEAVLAMIDDGAGRGLARDALAPRVGLSLADASALVGRLVEAGRVAAVGTVLVSAERLAELQQTLRRWVTAYHTAQPLEPGLPREEARERVGRLADASLFDPLVERLVSDGVLTAQEHLSLASHRIALSDEEERVRDHLAASLEAGGLAPPELAAVAAEAGFPATTADRMLKLLVRQGAVVRVESLVFHGTVLQTLKDQIRGLKTEARDVPVEIDVAGFKQRYGVTRKFAIPLLGYLDRERVTRRVGNIRIVL